jgi:hypothetical protein
VGGLVAGDAEDVEGAAAELEGAGGGGPGGDAEGGLHGGLGARDDGEASLAAEGGIASDVIAVGVGVGDGGGAGADEGLDPIAQGVVLVAPVSRTKEPWVPRRT